VGIPVGIGRNDLRGALGRTIQRLRGSELTPLRFALSVAVGLWVGCQPLYGLHFFLCAALTIPLRLNFLVAYAAAHISIPPSLPFLWFLALQLGSLFFTGGWMDLSTADFRPDRAADLGAKLVVGSLLLGSILAVAGGVLAYFALRLFGSRRGGPSPALRLEAAIGRTARRYRKAPPAIRHYVRFKLLLDPLAEQLYSALRTFVPEAEAGARLEVVDAGTGRGQYALLLHELGISKATIGFDHDADKIAAATIAAESVEATFSARDLRQGPYPDCDLVLLFDVLHYLSSEEQAAVVGLACGALRSGGHVLVRETDRGAGLGARLAGLFERMGRALGINRGERTELVSTRRLEEQLRQAGLLVLSAERRGALDNVLVVARKT